MNVSTLKPFLLAACLAGLAGPVLAGGTDDKKPYWQDIQTYQSTGKNPAQTS